MYVWECKTSLLEFNCLPHVANVFVCLLRLPCRSTPFFVSLSPSLSYFSVLRSLAYVYALHVLYSLCQQLFKLKANRRRFFNSFSFRRFLLLLLLLFFYFVCHIIKTNARFDHDAFFAFVFIPTSGCACRCCCCCQRLSFFRCVLCLRCCSLTFYSYCFFSLHTKYVINLMAPNC